MQRRTTKWIAATAFALAAAGVSAGQITIYDRPDFQGRALTTTSGLTVVAQPGFGAGASSIAVADGVWEGCTGTQFQGRCGVFHPGHYPNAEFTLSGRIASLRQVGETSGTVTLGAAPVVIYREPVALNPVPAAAPWPTGRIVIYEYPNFSGKSVVVDRGQAHDLDWANFTNGRNRASSVRVESGTWLVCSEMDFRGDCRTLGPGAYSQLPGALALGISSARQV